MSWSFPTCLRCLRVGASLARTPLLPHKIIFQDVKKHDFGQVRWKADDRKTLAQSMPIKDMGTLGEKELDIDFISTSKSESFFPEADTPNQIFNGIKFTDLPICHIKVTKNNTIMHLTDSLGNKIAYRSCGQEGFKNTRKGTNIAAQTTSLALAAMAKDKGVNSIRIAIQGLGPGRISSVKGLQMGGMKIIAIADTTRISWNPPRARKARRL